MNKEEVEKIAKFVHETNRKYCESIGDRSQVSWEETPDIIRQSVISGVEMYLKNPNMTPEQNHKAWLEYKAKEGWLYGNFSMEG